MSSRVAFPSVLCAILAAAAIVSAPLLPTPARAQAQQGAEQQQQQREAWGTACSTQDRNEPLDCSIQQRAIDSRTGRLLGMMRIRVPNDTRSPVMLVQMPLGIYLPAKLTISVDGQPLTSLDFQSCDQSGCYAGAPVPRNLLDAMVRGGTLSLSIQNRSRQPVSVPISLIGFAKAYDKVK